MVLLGIILGIVGVLFITVLLYGPVFFLNITIKRRHYQNDSSDVWLDGHEEKVSLISQDGLVLQASYIAAPKSPVTAILAHGYRGVRQELSVYARFFHDTLGYNVLLPDARSHGASEGKYIGFGWLERLDYLGWINWVKTKAWESAANAGHGLGIVLFGISMGGATVMMTAGEALPPEVKAVIEDCGYTSVEDELLHVLAQRGHKWGPWLVKLTGKLAQKKAGYSFTEASSLNQIRKAKVPVLFIHGEEDKFVPFRMVQPLYEACPSAKELYTVKTAAHGQSYAIDPAAYEKRVADFLKKYIS